MVLFDASVLTRGVAIGIVLGVVLSKMNLFTKREENDFDNGILRILVQRVEYPPPPSPPPSLLRALAIAERED